MVEDRPVEPALRGLAADGWIAQLEQSVGEDGYVTRLGKRHWAAFADRDTTLLVTFEASDAAMNAPLRRLAARRGWSHLSMIAEGETFWRDPLVWRYIDRLVDDAFFEDFDRVVFYGAGAAGYAACAFSVAAPGATVLAIQPRATLAPRLAGWDRRHLGARRFDFTSRYGYAPAMLEGCHRAFLIHDPAQHEDAMHASLFSQSWVAQLRAPHVGPDLEAALQRIGVLDMLVDRAMAGRLTEMDFARALRARRSDGPYLARLMRIAREAGSLRREAMVCRSVLSRLSAPAFRKRLDAIEAAMARGRMA